MRRYYTLSEVVDHTMRYGGDRPLVIEGVTETVEDCRRLFFRAWSKYPAWKLIEIQLTDISGGYRNLPCEHPQIKPYVDRRLKGSPFPAIVVVPGYELPYAVSDGFHRLRAAECAGDKTILAFAPKV